MISLTKCWDPPNPDGWPYPCFILFWASRNYIKYCNREFFLILLFFIGLFGRVFAPFIQQVNILHFMFLLLLLYNCSLWRNWKPTEYFLLQWCDSTTRSRGFGADMVPCEANTKKLEVSATDWMMNIYLFSPSFLFCPFSFTINIFNRDLHFI